MKNSLSNKILSYITENKNVTFVEIERIFEENGFDYKGLAKPSIGYVYWAGWNKKAVAIITELLDRKKIEIEPVHIYVYFVKGTVLNFPLVKSARRYKTSHWCPVVLNAVKTKNKKEV